MSSITQQLSALGKKERKQLFPRYRQLITSGGLTEEETLELRNMLKALGKSAQDAERDASILRRAAAIPAIIKDRERLKANYDKASAELSDAGLRRQEAYKKANDEYKAFVVADQQARREFEPYSGPVPDLNQLRKENPELLDF